MAEIIIYDKKTGVIFNRQSGWSHDQDPLTEDRQREMLRMMFPTRYYDVNMVVSEGDNAMFFPDIMEEQEIEEDRKTIDGRLIKKVKRKWKILKKNVKIKDITGEKPE